MGLCKCPKKKVTNLFCFEHKVNVCESCLVDSHDKCIVKSYLQWLEDNDYDPICTICLNKLNCDLDCIRLMCYDVFHLNCLNEKLGALPPTTAPAGFECPNCKYKVIPADKVAGPLAECLKKQLNDKCAWFQSLNNCKKFPVEDFEIIDNSINTSVHHNTIAKCVPDHSIYEIPDQLSQENIGDPVSNVRKTTQYSESKQDEGIYRKQYTECSNESKKRNYDENHKYSRKPLINHISTLFKAYFPLSTVRRSPRQAYRYFIISVCTVILMLLGLIWLLSILGRYNTDNDPMLDPRYNPNLIQQSHQQPPAPEGLANSNHARLEALQQPAPPPQL